MAEFKKYIKIIINRMQRTITTVKWEKKFLLILFIKFYFRFKISQNSSEKKNTKKLCLFVFNNFQDFC